MDISCYYKTNYSLEFHLDLNRGNTNQNLDKYFFEKESRWEDGNKKESHV